MIFPDEKKFNLFRPDGLSYHWHHLRRKPNDVELWSQLKDIPTVWEAIFYKGPIGLEGATGPTNARYYTTIFSDGLLSVANEGMGELWTLQQVNGSIHTADHMRCWPEENNVNVLNWPACSQDLSNFFNAWEYVARDVCNDERRFEAKEKIGDAVFEFFINISVGYVKNLYRSMPGCRITVIERKGAMINY